MQTKLTRPNNLQVWRIPHTASQDLAKLSERSMQLQATVQEQVLMMGKKYHLGLGRYSHQLLERLDRPSVVEMDQNIIHNQRHRLMDLAPLLETRKPQR
jgi:hypothetical protein